MTLHFSAYPQPQSQSAGPHMHPAVDIRILLEEQRRKAAFLQFCNLPQVVTLIYRGKVKAVPKLLQITLSGSGFMMACSPPAARSVESEEVLWACSPDLSKHVLHSVLA